MELKQLDRFLLKALLLCAAGIIVTEVSGYESVTSILFLMTFPLTVALWLRSVRRTLTGLDLLMLLTSLIATLGVILDVWIADGNISFDYFRKLIMFIMTLFFFQTANRIRVGQDIVNFTDWIIDLLTLFLIVMYFTRRSAMHMFNERITRYLTFGFKNPNTTGLFLACMFMMEMYRLFAREKWYVKTLHIAMAGTLLWFILETQSRNSLLVVLLFIVACLWLQFRSKRSLCITRFWSVVMAWFPLVFVGIYMMLVYTPWIQETLSFVVDIGKGLDSRINVWTKAVQNIAASPLIGGYYASSGGTGNFQFHNSHLDIAASYGIPVLIMVCILLTNYLFQKGRIYKDKESYSYILAFACAIMLGLGEAALFSGGLGIYIFVGMFLMLSNKKTADV